jgi:hypothetical protein
LWRTLMIAAAVVMNLSGNVMKLFTLLRSMAFDWLTA